MGKPLVITADSTVDLSAELLERYVHVVYPLEIERAEAYRLLAEGYRRVAEEVVVIVQRRYVIRDGVVPLGVENREDIQRAEI